MCINQDFPKLQQMISSVLLAKFLQLFLNFTDHRIFIAFFLSFNQEFLELLAIFVENLKLIAIFVKSFVKKINFLVEFVLNHRSGVIIECAKNGQNVCKCVELLLLDFNGRLIRFLFLVSQH